MTTEPVTELPELSDDVLARLNLTRAAWEQMRTSFREREKHAPVVGDAAPDFELPYLGQTAKTMRLSDVLRERPVALVFGSYT